MTLVKTEGVKTDFVIFIVVRELGPKILIGSSSIVEGGAEAVLDVRTVDLRNDQSLVNVRVHWQNSGPFYIKGVKTLDQDIKAALKSVFEPNVQANPTADNGGSR